MRKKLAALLCAVMCITAFTGCSKAELGYLQMSVDMLNSLEVCEASGKVNVDLDVDAMKEYVAELSKVAGYTDEVTQESLKELGTLKGKQSVVIDYTLKMNMDTLDYYLGMDMTYGGKKYAMGDMYFGMTDGIYVSSKTIWGIYELTRDMAGADKTSYLLDENFAKELKATLDQSKYINLISMEEMGLTEEEMAQISPDGGFSELYASVFEFYKNAFAGFTTNMVSEVSGGYKVQADGKAVAQLVVDLLDYVGSNPDTVMTATTAYMMDVMKVMKSSEEEIAEFKAQMDAVKGEVASMKETTDALKAMIQQAIATPVVSDVLDSFKYEATITRSGAGYNAKESFGITNGSKSVLKVTSDSAMKAGSGKVVMPTSSVSVSAFQEKLVGLTEKYNPVTAISVLWGWEGDSEAMLTKERAEVSLASNDTEMTDYVVKDGRVYLPLRMICEAMGETVEWNKDDKTAYVVREGGKTAMDGVLQDGKSFISVRDFEKLGYTVDYKAVDGLKEATVSK
ncbi:copper amine oxidase N-terminal domain-containing protein [Anaerotignum sp.]|uniref:copper amine oxidase N-terminal domain-containing protein n=1 Tax=Anaerotignum sp. TaxID=2039241 RepID=UPI00332FDDFB